MSAPDKDKNVVIFSPPKALKKKALTRGKGFSVEINAINRAEKALEDLSNNFDDWMGAEVQALHEARTAMANQSYDETLVDTLFLRAHDIKGQATTFGYPCAAELCASLCWLIETLPDKSRIPQILVDQHVDGVRAIVRENLTSATDEKATNLIEKLYEVSKEFVENELQQAQRKS